MRTTLAKASALGLMAAALASACLNVIGLDGYEVRDLPDASSGSGGRGGSAGSGGTGGASATGGTSGSGGTDGASGSGGAGGTTGSGGSDAGCANCNVSCPDASACPSGLACQSGKCVQPPTCQTMTGSRCERIPQCGCSSTETCLVDTIGSSRAGRCLTAGTSDLGEACQQDPQCRLGLACYAGRCSSFCNNNSDCAAGSVCRRVGFEATAAGVCLLPCDPFAPENPCGSGLKCAFAAHLADVTEPVCQRAGSSGPGGSCAEDAYVCGPGLTCQSNLCRELCGTVSPECSAGTCSPIGGGFDGGTYGACITP
jgi:hypothetical protein